MRFLILACLLSILGCQSVPEPGVVVIGDRRLYYELAGLVGVSAIYEELGWPEEGMNFPQ